MRRLFFIAWWSLVGAAAIVTFLRYLHPATFSRAVLPALLGLAFVSVVFAISNKRYE